jgi:hypothetical protein
MNQADGLLTIAILLVSPGSVGLVAFVCSEIGGRGRRSGDEASKGT